MDAADIVLVVMLLLGVLGTLYGVSLLYRGFARDRRHHPTIIVGASFVVGGVGAFYATPLVMQLAALETPSSVISPVTTVAIGLVLTALWPALAWGVGDRARGRRRCPRCWYDLEDLDLCPECGREIRSDRDALRTRRPRSRATVAMLFVLVAGCLWTGRRYAVGGWRALVPTPIIAAGLPWMPRTLLDEPDMGTTEDWTLAGRVARGDWTKLDRMLIGWRADQALRTRSEVWDVLRTLDMIDDIEIDADTRLRLILDIASDPNHPRAATVFDLVRLRDAGAPGPSRAVLEANRDAIISMLADPRWPIRIAGIEYVARLPDAEDHLRPFLDDLVETLIAPGTTPGATERFELMHTIRSMRDFLTNGEYLELLQRVTGRWQSVVLHGIHEDVWRSRPELWIQLLRDGPVEARIPAARLVMIHEIATATEIASELAPYDDPTIYGDLIDVSRRIEDFAIRRLRLVDDPRYANMLIDIPIPEATPASWSRYDKVQFARLCRLPH